MFGNVSVLSILDRTNEQKTSKNSLERSSFGLEFRTHYDIEHLTGGIHYNRARGLRRESCHDRVYQSVFKQVCVIFK